jgi:hypothetical protein
MQPNIALKQYYFYDKTGEVVINPLQIEFYRIHRDKDRNVFALSFSFPSGREVFVNDKEGITTFLAEQGL